MRLIKGITARTAAISALLSGDAEPHQGYDPSGGAVGCRVSEADYDAWRIDFYKGDQFGSGFVDLNPNSKIPALIDYGAVKAVRIFESGANLLYLAEKFGRFIPLDVVGRMEYMSWLF